METCPKIGMINFDLKTCNYESSDLGEKLSQFILVHYQENPESYTNEINEILKLREEALNASRDFMGLNLMKKYYRQLQFLSNRFPMKAGEACEFEISWDHLFDDREVAQTDIRFEQQCILYNIGAMHSYLGCLDKRNNDEGIKISCNHFQFAAWAFQKLKDSFSGYDFTSDLNEDVTNFKMNLMLAQAHECILEKSILDKRMPVINAKISAQIAHYYKLSQTISESQEFLSIVGSKQSKELKQYCIFKNNYYSALSLYFSALNSVESKKIGESIGFIQEAQAKITECTKMKYLKDFQETLQYVDYLIESKSKALKKENDFVYNEKIISAENLPELKFTNLVTPIAIDFDNDPEVASPDIFGRLVPMKAHELSSLYSEEKDKILRGINNQVDEKNTQLEQFLEALQINELNLKDFDYLKLPKELLECCASVSVNSQSIRGDLSKAMKKIVDVSVQTRSLIEEIEELFEAEDKEYRLSPDYSSDSSSDDEDINSKKIKKPLTPRKKKLHDLLDRYDTLNKNHDDANQSNAALRDAINSILSNLQILSLPLNELSEKLPKIELISDDESKNTRDMLLTLLSKLDEMKNQRAQLLHRLQRALQDDDITRVIASRQNEITNLSEFFQEQLKKHEQLLTYTNQNLQAQDNILRALADANAAFASERQKILDATKNRNTYVENLINSYQSISGITEKANKGVLFFEKLTEPLQNLLNDVKEFCNTQKKLRQNKNQPNTQFIQNSQPVNFTPLVNPYRKLDSDKNDTFKSEPVSERPRLKDFLPLMKPDTWGQNSRGKPTMPNISNPASAPPVPQQNFPPQQIPSVPNFAPQMNQFQSAPSVPQQNFPPQPITSVPNFAPQVNQFQNIPQNRVPFQNPALNFNSFQHPAQQPTLAVTDQRKLELEKQLKLQQEQILKEQLAKENEIELKRKQLEQQEAQLKYMQQQFQLQQIQIMEQQKQQMLIGQQKQQQALFQEQKQQQLILEKQKQEQFLLEQQKQQQQFFLDKQKLESVQNFQNMGAQAIFSNPQQTQFFPPNIQSVQNPTAMKINTPEMIKVLDEIKPDSVYKPGYLSQMKLPPINHSQVPTIPNINVNPVTLNHIPNFSPVQIPQVQTPINQQYRPNFTPQYNPAPQVLPPQVQEVKPIQQNIPAKSIQPSAIDDLFDLFSGSSTANPIEPILQPIRIDTNLISAQKIEVKTESVEKPSPKNEIKQEIQNLEKNLNNVNLNNNNLNSPRDQMHSNKLNFLSNQSKMEKFVNDVNKFEHHVNTLNVKTLSLNTVLDREWKELNDYQDKLSMSISIARLNPQKNRYQDLLPYDQTRICLQNKQNDYINASNLGHLSQDFDPLNKQPNFIITQLPLSNDFSDFWMMVYQEQIEIIINLCRENEINQNLYFPIDKNVPMSVGNLVIQLQSYKETMYSIQRVMTVQKKDGLNKTVIMLQHKNDMNKVAPVISSVTGIAQNEMPENIGSFLKFVKECENFYLKEQRNRKNPILVHCMNGVSRSAVFILIYSMIQIIDTLSESDFVQPVQLFSDLVLKLVKQMRSKRKYMIQSTYHLKYSYDAVLYYLKDMLIKEGVLVSNEMNYERRSSEIESNVVKDLSVSSIQSIGQDKNGHDHEGPISVNELSDPNKFKLDLNQENLKRKTSKKDFLNAHEKMPLATNDPFSWLEPLKK
ncbi:unnamed protein product [Brachionus calyciflorus]|uniref:Tyrosine-protein phosphatase non-receptor type 23 n=1 Tax=Brachionus calyciflorus TaxID=104777 RepID=A0A814BGF9_9BILA|nr:unnamed protein product [Brachionus calyciflorus]